MISYVCYLRVILILGVYVCAQACAYVCVEFKLFTAGSYI